MIDRDLQTLTDLRADIPLDRLEADVWTGIGKLDAARRAGRVITSCQAVALVVALLGSAAAGAATASAHPAGGGLALASGGLAPSNLLLGKTP